MMLVIRTAKLQVKRMGEEFMKSLKLFWAVCLGSAILLGFSAIARAQNAPVTLAEDEKTYTMNNGIVQAVVSKESGDLVSLRYKGLEMLATFYTADGSRPDLDRDPPGENRAGLNRGMTDHQYGFWSHDAMGPRNTDAARAIITIDPKANGGKRAEVAVKGISNGRRMGTGPGAGKPGNFVADVEIRWAIGRGESGVYTYTQFDHQPEYPATSITEARFCAKLADFFDWMSVAQDEHHNKYYPATLREGDKYVYTTNQYRNPAFGWSSTTRNVGFFIINPSNEFMSGGPTKVEFLGHRDTNQVAAPCVLNYWRSSHYGGADVTVAAGEQWTKVIGPFMLYVNSGSDPQAIYADARAQAAVQQKKWPMDWVKGVDYPPSSRRATVYGQIILNDSQAAVKKLPNLMVGLTAPEYRVSDAQGFQRTIDWQIDAKYYQFWAPGSENGAFSIPNVRPGVYALRAFADGVLGELAKADIKVEPGKDLDLGKVTWTPVRKGKQLWEIGIPNRNASEFFKASSYWEPDAPRNYADLFPDDINFVIGKSDFAKDWYFAHVPHYVGDPTVTPAPASPFFGPTYTGRETPRMITFDLPSAPKGTATLRVAINGTGVQAIPVIVNGERAGQLDRLRGDGTISRHGSQGLWYEKELSFNAAMLKAGTNTLILTVPAGNVNNGMLYDYLRLELSFSPYSYGSQKPTNIGSAV